MIEGMVTRGWGRVINISSVNGQKGQFGQTNYYPIGTKVKVLQVQEGEVQTLVAFQLVGTALGDRAPTLWTVAKLF
jgi:NADP-dependent 3-hydroxy acid dehydrogenase YdfG